jgi:hypothetical protein
MVALSVLPPEVISYILEYVPDKIGCYMTCKSWGTYLEQMFEDGRLSDVNDSYYLIKYCKTIDFGQISYEKCCCILHSINNYNSLNFISSREYISSRFAYPVLELNCLHNNISRPDYIRTLAMLCKGYRTEYMIDILDLNFYNDYYEMIKLLFHNKQFFNLWINSFVRRCYKHKYTFDVAIREINLLIVQDIMTPSQIHKIIVHVHPENLRIKQQLLLYLNDNYSGIS